MRHFDHIDLRVRNATEAHTFYEKISAALGFPYVEKGPEWTCYSVRPEPEIGEYLAVTEDPAANPGSACHALWAESRVDVDHIAQVLRDAGARAIEGPAMFYRGHYAVYFEDPSGNRFEVCHRESV